MCRGSEKYFALIFYCLFSAKEKGRFGGNVNSMHCWWVYYEGWKSALGTRLVPWFLTSPVGVSLIFRFIVSIAKNLCNQINLKLYQLTIATSERFILCTKQLWFLMSFSALIIFFLISITILYWTPRARLEFYHILNLLVWVNDTLPSMFAIIKHIKGKVLWFFLSRVLVYDTNTQTPVYVPHVLSV